MNEEEKSNEKQVKTAKKASLKARLLAVLISPVVFILLIELVLRFSGYGLSSHFFVPWTMGNQTIYLPNDQFCEHFVPESLSRAPEPSVLLPKSRDTFRIFVLGGSAANGDPDSRYGFCRQLEILLNAYSEKTRFEVINAAVTSMNSHVARRIAMDCAEHEPDLFIVYMGNNEVVGPYGPPTMPEALYKHRSLIDLSVTLKKDVHLGQLIKKMVEARSKGDTEITWQGMEAFLESHLTLDDPKLQMCYSHFKNNLADIANIAQRCGAKTFFCTVPTNLADCAPFGSQHQKGLSELDLEVWNTAFKAGRALQIKGDMTNALAEYEKALAIDDQYADLAYSMGQCLLKLEKTDEAKASLLRARDLDTLRFRADTSINQIVRDQSQALVSKDVELLDLVGVLEQANQGKPLGQSLLLDHVHLTMIGNAYLARAAAKAIAGQYPALEVKPDEAEDAVFLSQCQRRLLFDVQAQYDQAMVMYQRKIRPPFAQQLDHDQTQLQMRNALYQMRSYINQSDSQGSLYTSVFGQAQDDRIVIREYAAFLVRDNQLDQAIALLEKTLSRCPYDALTRHDLARLYAAKGGHEQAMALLVSKESPFPCTEEEALEILGTYYVKQGRYLNALQVYTRLNELTPNRVGVLVNLASAATYQQDYVKVAQVLKQALKIDPNSCSAMINLGNLFVRQNETLEALAWFERAVENDPYNYIATFSMGMQKLKLGQVRDGMKYVTDSVQLRPDFVEGYETLVKVYTEFDKPETAQKYATIQSLFTTDK